MVVNLQTLSSSANSSPSRDSSPLLLPTSAGDVQLYVRHYCSRLTHITSSRLLQFAFFVVSISLCVVIYTTVRGSTSDDFMSTTSTNLLSSSLLPIKRRKIIMGWTQWFDKDFTKIWNNGGQAPFLKHCPSEPVYADCELIDDRRRIKEADAVVFHVPDLVWKLSLLGGYDVPSYRASHQRYVFMNQESPAHTLTNLDKFANFFNWTMTYRRDSDIWAPYALFENVETKSNSTLSPPSSSMLQNKTGWVAWVVSRCYTHSRREHFVNELKQHIPVDVWGRCGSKGRCDSQCFKEIAKNYRFYISIENSLCTDYVTEKFFSRLQELDAVLIVLQPRNISGSVHDNYVHIAPKGSYIDASKFDSPKSLAGYLRAVGSEPSIFSSFFQWRSHQTIRRNAFDHFCELCKALHENRPAKVYGDMKDWWVGGGSTLKKSAPVSKAHCQPGKKFNKDGDISSPPYQVPYFVHIQS